jgi:predicted nuclease with RNAse H fold
MAEGGTRQAPLRVEGGNFSLSLDPERYPLLPAADGGKILIDAEGALPPYVKEILREKEPGVRIVTERPANSKRFFTALLAAAGFYSVEEDFAVHLGTDPKVTVTSDFKIEKNQESLLNNDVFLLNVSEARTGLPPSLVSHMEKEGFHVIELFPSSPAGTPAARHVLYSISSETQQGIVDAILSAFSFSAASNRDIALDDGSLSGVSLSVRADRYIETAGGNVLLSFSDANPVQYTLFKLLQLKGYQVVTIHPTDDFRKVSEKVLSALKISASFGIHHLGDPRGTPVDVQLSGFVARGTNGNTILTNVGVDSLVREIAGFKGYSVIDK